MITIRMNDDAADALGLLVGTATSDVYPELDDQLREMLSRGLTRNDDALVFVINDRGGTELTAGSRDAMARMGWNTTQYECRASSFHLEDHAPVTVDVVDDEPHISREDQVLMLELGLRMAHGVDRLVRSLPNPVPVRCIIGAGSTNGTFRLHQLREGESWLVDDLDRYQEEMLVVVDIEP
ncbi:hypothetical protein GCM10023191_002030 [Actinoallomurus oryzae]|uniref:Uncharacterized protein n=1 Tax=Actinoallomurus oryzae TaxID=502180 RepID=A0ABP8P5C5_9ACTN